VASDAVPKTASDASKMTTSGSLTRDLHRRLVVRSTSTHLSLTDWGSREVYDVGRRAASAARSPPLENVLRRPASYERIDVRRDQS
jgi:hypothetical protein